MPGVPTPISLSNTTPAAPAGRQNVQWQADVNNPRNVSASVPISQATTLEDTHANRLASYPPANYPSGTQFVETDRNVIYINRGNQWVYLAGMEMAAYASRPTDLGSGDAGFAFFASDTLAMYVWSGSQWLQASGGAAAQPVWGPTTTGEAFWQ